MGLLDGGAAALFTQVMTPLYLPAIVYGAARVYDNFGRYTVGDDVERSCRAQVDSATETMRAQPDYSDTDRAIYVLANTLGGDLSSDDEISVTAGPYAGSRWKVSQPIDRDPAGAYWRCRGVLGEAEA